jgi:hypothetical protein
MLKSIARTELVPLWPHLFFPEYNQNKQLEMHFSQHISSLKGVISLLKGMVVYSRFI